MKKIFTTIFVLCAALSMQAGLHITVNQVINDEDVITEITQDTTILVSEYEWDEDLEEATMGITGNLYSDETNSITVTIERENTGIIDQFCAAGNCVSGNGELNQTCEFTIGTMELQRSWFTHYTPLNVGIETITYTFSDTINPEISLTIVYNYSGTAVEDVVVRPTDNTIYNLLGQRMPTNEFSELPAGIYIVNGKKIIKQ